jgi:GxxExxY protein
MEALPVELEKIAAEIVDGSIRVHSELGPGLLENSYEICLFHELTQRGLHVERQVELPIHYRNVRLDAGYRLDLLIENSVIVEIKAVDRLLAVHTAQVLTYLKLSKKRLGFLINFNSAPLKTGIKRLVL